MRYCPDCGSEVTQPGSKFCPDCGTKLDVESASHDSRQADSAMPVASQSVHGIPNVKVLAIAGAAALVVILVAVGFFAWSAYSSSQKQAAEQLASQMSLVPDVRGLTALQASQTLKKAGLAVGKIDYDPKAKGAAGAVVNVNPAANTRANKGAVVVLTVAGPEPIKVPDFVGLSRTGAQAAARAADLSITLVETKSKAKAGTVLSQNPGHGATVPPGASVNVFVSKGSAGTSGSNSDGSYTPKKGSAERTAIMDACRIYLNYSGKFVVNELRVKGSRAYADVTPEDYPSYGATGVYLLKNASGWVVSTDTRTAADRGSLVSSDDWLNNR